ncbi:MAG: FAD-dependent oxidoreductase [Lachnospiraceae bacterium]|nr:FAD-dependent oxidoreductase [Lachnospiraceae bacterium]
MIQIQQLKLPISHTKEDLEKKISKLLKIQKEQIKDYQIVKQSIDARKKNEISFVYTVEVETGIDEKILKKVHQNTIQYAKKKKYEFPMAGSLSLANRPVIAGSGPAGLFCAYMLAKAGYAPIVLERGKTVEERTKDVSLFWKGGILDTQSNVQFGEGGAGTFSDGKLNTLVKDPLGRNRKVLEIFTAHGAPKEICYEAKPHIGTDILAEVIPAIRKDIEAMGGTFYFKTCMTDIVLKDGKIQKIQLNHDTWIDTEVLVLAIGHSARDTFEMLAAHQIPMEAKSFAVGFRVEHPQSMINLSQYGEAAANILPPAPYKVTGRGLDSRGVYSFCMCPGGYVVNASSEEKRLAVNGMSYYKRDSKNANSAIIVSVSPQDFGSDAPLAGVKFQRKLEERAFTLGEGAIPQQLYGDYKKKKMSNSYGAFDSQTCGNRNFGALHELFSEDIYTSFILGMESFAKKIPDFNREDTILSGVESRTSSPVRIHRNESFQSEIVGIYPCGEGAGYAGGIMSAAMDGLKVAEAIAKIYAPVRTDN